MTKVISENTAENIRDFFTDIKKFVVSKFFFISLLLIILFLLFKSFFIISALIIIGALSIFYKRFLSIGLGIELITLVTVLGGISYGSGTGALIGFTSMTIGMIITNKMFKDVIGSLVNIGLMTIVGFFSVLVPAESLVIGGLILTISYDILFTTLMIIMVPRIGKLIVYVLTHAFFNYIFFKILGKAGLNLINSLK